MGDAAAHPTLAPDSAAELTNGALEEELVRESARASRQGGRYIAPESNRLPYVPLPAGTGAPARLSDAYLNAQAASADVRAKPGDDDTAARMVRYFRRGQRACNALLDAEANKRKLREERTPNVAVERRGGLWAEFHRSLAIASDRLWVFVRLLSGHLGEDVNTVLTMADDTTTRDARQAQRARIELAKKTIDTQAKIVEIVVASFAKNATLAFDAQVTNDDQAQLLVVDDQTRRHLKELAQGTSGRPFFESGLAKSMLEKSKTPLQLTTLLKELANVGTTLQAQLRETEETAFGGAGGGGASTATLTELSHPSNSYFVALKTDAVAAIRTAHELSLIHISEPTRPY